MHGRFGRVSGVGAAARRHRVPREGQVPQRHLPALLRDPELPGQPSFFSAEELSTSNILFSSWMTALTHYSDSSLCRISGGFEQLSA